MKRRVVLYCIGIDEYDEYPTLSFCTNDALVVSDTLILKLKPELIKLFHLSDDHAEKPTKENITTIINDITKLNMGENDLVIFYFAGHGFSCEGSDYLVCSNSIRDNIKTSIKTDDIISALNSSGAGLTYLIIDACRLLSGREISIFGEQTAELARRQGVVAFMGCSPGEVCQELAKYQHGIFTYSFLKVIEDKTITTPLEIDRRVLESVTKIYKENKLSTQRPYTTVAPIQKAIINIYTGEIVDLHMDKQGQPIIILGPCNSGKTTLGQYLSRKLGYVHLEMSSIAYKYYQDNKDFIGSIQDFIENVLWRENDKDIIAKGLIASQKQLNKQVVICGARTLEEIETLKAHFKYCKVIYLFANASVRHNRYIRSGQINRYQLSYKELVERDLREFGWGLAKAVALPDTNVLINETTIEDLYRKAEPFVKK